MGFKHPYSSLKIKMIKPRPRPPRIELATQSSSASDGMKHDANSSTVDSSMKLPQRKYTRASAEQRTDSTRKRHACQHFDDSGEIKQVARGNGKSREADKRSDKGDLYPGAVYAQP